MELILLDLKDLSAKAMFKSECLTSVFNTTAK